MFIPRLCSSIVLLSLFGGMIFAPHPYNVWIFWIFSTLLTFFLTREMCVIFKKLNMEVFDKTVQFMTVLSVFLFNMSTPENSNNYIITSIVMSLFFICSIGCILYLLFTENKAERIRKLFHSIALYIFILIPIFMIVSIYYMGLETYGKYNIIFLFFVLMTKIGDIGAYITGTLSNRLLKGGNHKMVPSISPGKSWEGAAGGLIITTLLCWGFHHWFMMIPNISGIFVVSILFFFGGMAGDLAESVIKRAAGIKDSGHAIPGIGGVYDLVDSLFMTAPIFLFIFFLGKNTLLAFLEI